MRNADLWTAIALISSWNGHVLREGGMREVRRYRTDGARSRPQRPFVSDKSCFHGVGVVEVRGDVVAQVGKWLWNLQIGLAGSVVRRVAAGQVCIHCGLKLPAEAGLRLRLRMRMRPVALASAGRQAAAVQLCKRPWWQVRGGCFLPQSNDTIYIIAKGAQVKCGKATVYGVAWIKGR